MNSLNLEFARELEIPIFYKNYEKEIGTRRADFLAQILNYLKAYKIEVGLLINFGSKSLTFKRVVLDLKK